MPDNLNLHGSPDNKRININEPYELRDWAKHFNVTQQQIIDAVNAVGDSAAKVKQYLGK